MKINFEVTTLTRIEIEIKWTILHNQQSIVMRALSYNNNV